MKRIVKTDRGRGTAALHDLFFANQAPEQAAVSEHRAESVGGVGTCRTALLRHLLHWYGRDSMECYAISRMPIFLLVEWDWFPPDDLFLVEYTDTRRVVRAYTSQLEAQSAALLAFHEFAEHWGGKPELYDQDPRILEENWSSIMEVEDQYEAMVECLRAWKDNRLEHPYGTMYEVERMTLPPESWNLSPPFSVFAVGKTRLPNVYNHTFDPLHGCVSILSLHVDELEALEEAVSRYEDHVSRTGQEKLRDAIEGWECMKSMQRYRTMLKREVGRDLKESAYPEFGVIFPVMQIVVT